MHTTNISLIDATDPYPTWGIVIIFILHARAKIIYKIII